VYRGIGGGEAACAIGVVGAPGSCFTTGTLGPVPGCPLAAAGEPAWVVLLGVLATERREGDSLAGSSKDWGELFATELDRIRATGAVAAVAGRPAAVGVPAAAGAAAAVRDESGGAAAFTADRMIVTD
jgi:hypothetical protein